MWEAMHLNHHNQHDLFAGLRACEFSLGTRETSEQHHETTIQLCQTVQEWHLNFQTLVTRQKEYIKALNSWLELNLIPIESGLKEKLSSPSPSPSKQVKPPIQDLIHAWHGQLEKLSDGNAKNAIFSFFECIRKIVNLQEDELKLKETCEESRKEFIRTRRNFEDWHLKHVEKKTDGAGSEDVNHKVVEERKFSVESVELRLKSEEEAYQKTCDQVRRESIVSLTNKLPDLFHAMSEFSLACFQMYKQLQIITQSENPPASG